MAWEEEYGDSLAEATAAFERLGHKLHGEIEIEHSSLCCGGWWFMMRCSRCNWYWSFDPLYTHEFKGPSQVKTPICLGHH